MLVLHKRKGSAKVAVNEWLSYFNVRINHVEIVAGQETIVTVQPTQHVATEAFRAMDVDERGCRFPEENPVL